MLQSEAEAIAQRAFGALQAARQTGSCTADRKDARSRARMRFLNVRSAAEMPNRKGRWKKRQNGPMRHLVGVGWSDTSITICGLWCRWRTAHRLVGCGAKGFIRQLTDIAAGNFPGFD